MSLPNNSEEGFRPLINRRHFMRTVGVAAAGAAFAGCETAAPRRISANEKLNVGVIGVAGQGGFSISNLKDQNIVALCDVDSTNLAKVSEQFPSAKTRAISSWPRRKSRLRP
jgi:hypothetical protein